jgi:hypothetical protein
MMVGTMIANRMVLFSRDGELIHSPVKINITGDENVKVLITDISEGDWKVECLTDNDRSISSIKNSKQLLYFTARKGEYVISKK